MQLKDYVENLLRMMTDHPETMNLPVYLSRDGSITPITSAPTFGASFEDEYVDVVEAVEKGVDITPDRVCIN